MLSTNDAARAREDEVELRERMVALSERIVALAEAANIVAEAAAPFRAFPTQGEGASVSFGAGHDGFKALDRAAARLEAARLAAVDEFVAVQAQLGEGGALH